jgi:hypothetical protein
MNSKNKSGGRSVAMKSKKKFLSISLICLALMLWGGINMANAGYFDYAAQYSRYSAQDSAAADYFAAYAFCSNNYGYFYYMVEYDKAAYEDAYEAYYYAYYGYAGYALNTDHNYYAYIYSYYAYLYKYYAYVYSYNLYYNGTNCYDAAEYSYLGDIYNSYAAYYNGAASVMALN